MNQKKLSVFSQPEHPKMCGPFSFGLYSYATNGHVLVRVPRLADVPEWDALNEKAAVMFDGVGPDIVAALAEIPDFPQPEPETCTVCKGVGKISKCPECDGDGEVMLENDYNEYECECQTCGGDGSVSGNATICSSCTGTGRKIVTKRITIGCTGFSSHYLTMLKELPGMKLAPTEPEKGNYFKWDDGDGMLMPMRA
jgi:hypothetical protein